MVLTWEQIDEDIRGYYEGRQDRVVTPKALKMFLTRFRNIVRPKIKTPMEIIRMNETQFVKSIRQAGKEIEEAISFLRAKYCAILQNEKDEEEKEERFLAYKKKLDDEYNKKKEELMAQYNPKFKLKELYALVQALETCGIETEHTELEIDLIKLEEFRKAIKVMHV